MDALLTTAFRIRIWIRLHNLTNSDPDPVYCLDLQFCKHKKLSIFPNFTNDKINFLTTIFCTN